MLSIEVYHTQEYRLETLTFPILSEGSGKWLGDGFYFWQDFDFAKWWGDESKCPNRYRQYSVFKTKLEFEQENFIDTVFNETDYYNFVKIVEKFAKKFQRKFQRKPSLEEFNDFIFDHGIWQNIKIIRFQDVPPNNYFVEVLGFFYKKRIQIRVNEPGIIVTFTHFKDFFCVNS